MSNQYYANHLINQLHNLRQGHIYIHDYIAIFKNLTHRNDVREHHYETITRFVWSLWSKIRRVMITSSYDLDTIEEAFDVTLRIDLAFKMLVNAKARCCKCEGYEHYDYQCPSESQHVTTMLTDDVDDSKIVEDVHVPSKTVSIIEDIAVGSDTPIIDVHISSDSASDDVDEIIEPNTPTMTNKTFKFPCDEYSFMVVPIDSSFSKSSEFLAKI